MIEQAAFGSGAIATGVFTTVPGLVLLYYLTDTLGVAAGLAGLAVALPRLLDLLSNPVVGRLSDRTFTRWGPRRPWILVGGLLLPITFAALFFSPVTGNAAALWVGGAFAMGGVCFALYSVPWGALPAEIGVTPHARTTMTSWRVAFLALAILASGGLAPTIVEAAGGGSTGYRAMALVMAALMVVAVLFTVFVGARRSRASAVPTTEVGSLRDAVSLIRRNVALRTVVIVVMLCEAAAATALASVPYIADHVVGSSDAVTVVFIAVVAPMLVTMPLWSRIAGAVTNRVALRSATAVFAVGAALLLSLPFLPPEARLQLTFGAALIVGVGLAGTSMLPLAMLADAISEEADSSGVRRAGLITGAAGAAETVAGSLGAGLYAVLLSIFGFVSSQPGEAVLQTPIAQFGIVFAVGGVALLALLAVNVALNGYRIDGSASARASRDGGQEAAPVR